MIAPILIESSYEADILYIDAESLSLRHLHITDVIARNDIGAVGVARKSFTLAHPQKADIINIEVSVQVNRTP